MNNHKVGLIIYTVRYFALYLWTREQLLKLFFDKLLDRAIRAVSDFCHDKDTFNDQS